ncbi:MAG: hypothetical protein ABI366_09290 [Ginsengibacter sp.]
MRYPVLFSILLFAILTGCSKVKFESTPSLKFKSVSSKIIPPGFDIQFTLEFADAEGDLNDSIYIEKKEPTCVASNFTDYYDIPSFPVTKNEKGDILINFRSIDIAPQCQRNDTAFFRFVIKDKAGHVSDTATSPPIVILYQ